MNAPTMQWGVESAVGRLHAPRMQWGVESAVGRLHAPRSTGVCLTSSLQQI